jgi:hypothetical protein
MEAPVRKVTYKLYPSRNQLFALRETRRLHQQIYNACLEQRIDADRKGGIAVSYADQGRELCAGNARSSQRSTARRNRSRFAVSTRRSRHSSTGRRRARGRRVSPGSNRCAAIPASVSRRTATAGASFRARTGSTANSASRASASSRRAVRRDRAARSSPANCCTAAERGICRSPWSAWRSFGRAAQMLAPLTGASRRS